MVYFPEFGFADASEEKVLEYKQLIRKYLSSHVSSLKQVLLVLEISHKTCGY